MDGPTSDRDPDGEDDAYLDSYDTHDDDDATGDATVADTAMDEPDVDERDPDGGDVTGGDRDADPADGDAADDAPAAFETDGGEDLYDSDPDDPPGLKRARTVAHLLDDAIPVPGTGFSIGLDSIVGLLPVAGDLVTAGLGLYIVAEGVRMGVDRKTVFWMLLNIVLDVAIGSIPVAGDLFDAVWKSNRRNIALLEDHLDAQSD